jgi:protein-L-isoaspartate(D-aspartate) O-methyltransferase
MDESRVFYLEREQMIVDQIIDRGIHDRRVIAAMQQVPRHLFVDPADRMHAYDDHPLPTLEGQTISQPFMVALMISLLHLNGTEVVL